jgi:transcriptional regulator with XRE-family HTH domain
MEALGQRAGLDRTYVGLLERGKRQPTVVVAVALADALGLSLGDLLVRAEHMAMAGDQDDPDATALDVGSVLMPTLRMAKRACTESDSALQDATGLTAEVICLAIDDSYHTLDLVDRQLVENDAPPLAKLVELANLSSMIGNVVGSAITRHSNGGYERSGPHKYQDLRSTTDGEHVEIKIALEDNKPKGHLSKAGHYLTFRYVLGDRDGSFVRKQRGEVVYVWEVRFGYLREIDFSESNTPGDSGKTAVIKTDVLKQMERVYFDPDYFPMARLSGAWGPKGLF